MKPIPGNRNIVGEQGSVQIRNFDEPYHAFHTHPSDSPLSFPDVRNMVNRENQISITAQGERGSKSVLIREKNCDNIGYRTFLSEKGSECYYIIGNKAITLSYLHDENNKREIVAMIDSLSKEDKDAFYAATRAQTDFCLKGGEGYGFKYKFQSSKMAD